MTTSLDHLPQINCNALQFSCPWIYGYYLVLEVTLTKWTSSLKKSLQEIHVKMILIMQAQVIKKMSELTFLLSKSQSHYKVTTVMT